MANTRWKAHLAAALEALRPAYDSGTENYKTTIARTTLTQLRTTIPFGKTNGARLENSCPKRAFSRQLTLTKPIYPRTRIVLS